MGTSLAAVLLLSSSVSTVTLATTAACEGNTTKSKLPSVPLMERSRQGTQSIIPDASHHYHYGDDMLPSILLRPRILETTIEVSEDDASSSIQEYSNRSPSSLQGGSTTTTMARSGFAQNLSKDQIVVEGNGIQMATITLKPGQTIRTRGGLSGLPDQWYPYEDRDCARRGITLSHQQSTLYD